MYDLDSFLENDMIEDEELDILIDDELDDDILDYMGEDLDESAPVSLTNRDIFNDSIYI